MKTIMSILVLMCGVFTLQAQDIKPQFQKEGDMVKATYFHDNGAIAQVGYFMDGKLHGEWKMYNAQGHKIAMGQYEMGTRTGKWFYWNSDGLREVDFVENQIASVTQWNNGEAVAINR